MLTIPNSISLVFGRSGVCGRDCGYWYMLLTIVIISVIWNAYAATCNCYVIELLPIHLVTRLDRLTCYTRTYKGPNVKWNTWCLMLELYMFDESVKINMCSPIEACTLRWLLGWLLATNGSTFWVYSGRTYQPPNVTNITVYSVDWFILSLTRMMDHRKV